MSGARHTYTLAAAGLSFAYARRDSARVIDDLTWSLAPNCKTLLLGSNGAGKSTLLKLLCGYINPRSGTVTVNGNSSRGALRNTVGWMPQDIRPAPGMTCQQQLEYAGWAGGVPRRVARSKASTLLDQVGLIKEAGQRADRISGGQLRRLGLAQACMRPSQALLLDEPTAGLDPAQSQRFHEVLKDLELPGGVLISSHQISDLAEDVDRIAVLNRGRIVFDATVDEFRDLATAEESLAQIFLNLVGDST